MGISQSKRYFARAASAWDEMRAGYFSEAMRDAAIERAGLRPGAVVADVGTGTGFVLQGLVGRAAVLVGFDESPEMLAVARQKLAGRPEVYLRLAEGRRLPASDGCFDAVFANMYLHHAPEPAAAVAEMARVLKPGGRLLVTDLDRHDQAWMLQEMADRWPGFARAEVRRWFEAAGLAAVSIEDAAERCRTEAPAGEALALSVFLAIGSSAGEK